MLASPWVVIPVKPFAVGKSRLLLPQAARTELNRSFFAHVLDVAAMVVPATNIVTISRDDAVLAMARCAGAHGLAERDDDLNHALEHGARFAADRGATAIVSLFADLPYLARDDIDAMFDRFRGHNVVLAPDESSDGTNAMMMSVGEMAYRHGPDSLSRHLASAQATGIDVSIVRRDGLMRDIDTPNDLADLVLQKAFLNHRKRSS